MGTWHVVKQGEWLATIAAHYGVSDWKTLWNDPHNAALKQSRKPEILFPGDRLYVPDRTSKTASGATGQQHNFVLKAAAGETLRVKVLDAADSPLVHQPFRLTVGTQKFTGVTTEGGEAVVSGIQPSGSHKGTLELVGTGLTFPVAVGSLNPASEKKSSDPAGYDNGVSGVQMRLANLGFDPGPPSGALSPQTRSALQHFQSTVMHRPAEKSTGELDSETRSAIIKSYGC